jgi:hypothetical protein
VEIACSISAKRLDNAAKVLAGSTNGSKDTLKRKMEAIQYAQSRGIETDAIKAIGSSKILSDYIKAKKGERIEELTALTYRMAPDLKDKVQKQFVRIAKTLKLTTSDQLFEFLHSVIVDWTEEEILHAAGEGHDSTVTRNSDTRRS